MNLDNLKLYAPEVYAKLYGAPNYNSGIAIKSNEAIPKTIQELIAKKPSTKIVREYYRNMINKIVDIKIKEEDESLNNLMA